VNKIQVGVNGGRRRQRVGSRGREDSGDRPWI